MALQTLFVAVRHPANVCSALLKSLLVSYFENNNIIIILVSETGYVLSYTDITDTRYFYYYPLGFGLRHFKLKIYFLKCLLNFHQSDFDIISRNNGLV